TPIRFTTLVLDSTRHNSYL
ncbi:hypothetical protein D046_3754B, partial [Vibrio parahaemolyticus V-223/04]